jgi:electron transport complex protein RnfG
MRLSRRMLIVLSLIGLVSGALLMSVNMFTKDRIASNRKKEIEKAVIKVIPGTKSSLKIYEEKDFTVYKGRDDQGNVLGIAINTAAGGFQDRIFYIFGLDTQLTRINSLFVLDQKETPGLGAKITSAEAFLQFWEGRDVKQPLVLRKPAVKKDALAQNEVNTVTGATISSRAILASVNVALEKIKKLKQEGRFSIEGSDGD